MTGLRTMWERLTSVQALPIAAATILLFAVGGAIVPATVSTTSLTAMIVPASVMAVAAIGQTLVIQQKGIDLSTSGVITLSSIVYAQTGHGSVPPVLALLVALVASAAIGAVNGLVVTRLNITPIVATLASNSLVTGAVFTVSHGSLSTAPRSLSSALGGAIGGIPVITLIAGVLVVVVAVLAVSTSAGRRFTGVGASARAARAAGAAPERYVVGSYVASALAAGVAGILLLGYIGSTSLTLGVSYQLPVIAAVVVGGAALTGGRGSVAASAIGALFLAQIVQFVLTLGAPNSVQLLVQSIALAAAATLRLLLVRRRWRRRVEVVASDAAPTATSP
jgi:ribose transport system permease protein